MARGEFVNWVRARRQELGLSQIALSRKIGMSDSYVAQLEHQEGIGRPSRGVVFAISEAFGAEVGPVLSMAGYDDPDLERYLHVLETDRHLRPEHKQLLRSTYLTLRDLNDRGESS